jgi:hypothetical protein
MNNTRKIKEKDIFADLGMNVYSIDIDFKLNDGKGAWVVVLERNDCCLQSLSDMDVQKNGRSDELLLPDNVPNKLTFQQQKIR